MNAPEVSRNVNCNIPFFCLYIMFNIYGICICNIKLIALRSIENPSSADT